MPNFDYPQNFVVLEDTQTGVIEIPLDGFFDCRDFDTFDPAGCRVPAKPSWCFPFDPSDYIYLQLNEIPTLIEFFEFDGTAQLIPYILEGKTIIIDASLVPSFICAFYLKIDGRCTYAYTREACPGQSVSIESAYIGRDPLGFDYTGSFRNFARIPGGFELTGTRTEDTATANGRLVSKKTFERYALKSLPMPAAVWRYYANILHGSRVKVQKDGKEYNLVSLDEKKGKTVFQIDAVLETFIKKNNFC